MVQELHETHPGMARMKALARQYVWWPNLDAELEAKVKSCTVCQVHRNRPESAPLHPWEWPQKNMVQGTCIQLCRPLSREDVCGDGGCDL